MNAPKEVKNEQMPADKTKQNHNKRKISPFGHLFRFIGLWFGFTGLYSMFAVCPCCGQQECPVGLAAAGGLGAFFTLCVQDWRRLFGFLKRKLLEKRAEKINNK